MKTASKMINIARLFVEHLFKSKYTIPFFSGSILNGYF